MDSLSDLLGNRQFDEPAEAIAIKQYVDQTYHAAVSVQVREREIIISAASAALVNQLRYNSATMQQLAQTDKRLVFRITG
jgi:hypothetical protein